MSGDALAKLARQNMATGDRQVALDRLLGCGEIKNVFLNRDAIESPRHHPGATSSFAKSRDRPGRTADREMMKSPTRRVCVFSCPLIPGGCSAPTPPDRSRSFKAGPAAQADRETPRACENPSEIDHPGRAFIDQAGALHVAAHGAQIAMAGVAHDVLVAHAVGVGLGDEADAQRVCAEPLKALQFQSRHPDAIGQNVAHRVRMQRFVGDAVAGADAAKQRAGFVLCHCLPGFKRAQWAGLDMAAARQADLGPLPCLVGLATGDAQTQPPATTATSSTCSATSSERRSAPAKPISSSARSRRPRAVLSQVETSWRSMGSVSAAAFCTGRPCSRSRPCSGPWMSRWAGFHGRSLNRCILPIAKSRRRMVVGAWLVARLAR